MASSKESNTVIAADAIIVRDFGHQLSANAFVRHNRRTARSSSSATRGVGIGMAGRSTSSDRRMSLARHAIASFFMLAGFFTPGTGH
jgi:hypothetical protein